LINNWMNYVKEIDNENDYANWPGPPLEAFRRASAIGGQSTPAPAAACDLAAAHWASAESIGTLAAYEDHLARFPNCTFATLAKARIEALRK
jgi:hypothetical protein